MASDQALAGHWDDAYAGGDASRSWFQPDPVLPLRMLEAAGVTAASSLIDVGGGASSLGAALLERGFRGHPPPHPLALASALLPPLASALLPHPPRAVLSPLHTLTVI